jgi:hypothetical protein
MSGAPDMFAAPMTVEMDDDAYGGREPAERWRNQLELLQQQSDEKDRQLMNFAVTLKNRNDDAVKHEFEKKAIVKKYEDEISGYKNEIKELHAEIEKLNAQAKSPDMSEDALKYEMEKKAIIKKYESEIKELYVDMEALDSQVKAAEQARDAASAQAPDDAQEPPEPKPAKTTRRRATQIQAAAKPLDLDMGQPPAKPTRRRAAPTPPVDKISELLGSSPRRHTSNSRLEDLFQEPPAANAQTAHETQPKAATTAKRGRAAK